MNKMEPSNLGLKLQHTYLKMYTIDFTYATLINEFMNNNNKTKFYSVSVR